MDPRVHKINGLLIFDFDLTLSKDDLFMMYGNRLDISQKDDNWKRQFQLRHFNQFDKMKKLFNVLVNDFGFKICIASFGYKYMIDKYIEMSYGFDLIKQEDIVGTNGITTHPDDKFNISFDRQYAISYPHCNNISGICKNHIIKYFMSKYINDTTRVAFFDDNYENINQAKNICTAILIDPPGSLSVTQVVDVIKNKMNTSLQLDNFLKNTADFITNDEYYKKKYLKYKQKYVDLKKNKN